MTLIDELTKIVGQKGVLTAAQDTAPFLEDWRGRYRGKALCVVLPASTEQVSAVVTLCAQTGTRVLAQGGNTSLCGGAVPDDRRTAAGHHRPAAHARASARSIRPTTRSVVDAGCVLAAVQQAAIDSDRLYPVSLGAEGSCQIGGTIATNAGGTGVLRYGNTRDNVLGLEVVLPDGSIWNGLHALRKNNTGYDLKHLFIGSEGTLGIITGAVLKLHPLPTARSVAWLGVASPQAALDMLGLFRAALRHALVGLRADERQSDAMVLEHVPGRRRPIADARLACPGRAVRHRATRAALDAAMQGVLERALERGLVTDAVVAANEAQRAAMWEFRHSVSEANKKGRRRPDHRLRRARFRRSGFHRERDAMLSAPSCRTCRS